MSAPDDRPPLIPSLLSSPKASSSSKNGRPPRGDRQRSAGSTSSSLNVAAAEALTSSLRKNNSVSWDQSSFTNSRDMHQHQRDASMASTLASMEELINKDDQAERGLINSMEQRRTPTETTGGDVWHASVQGERPPLGGAVPLHFQHMIQGSPDNLSDTRTGGSSHRRNRSRTSVTSASEGSRSSQNSATTLANIARRMRQKATVEATTSPHSSYNDSHQTSSSSSGHHRRGQSRAHALLDSIQENYDANNDPFDGVGVVAPTTLTTDTQDSTTAELSQASTSTDKLITGAMHVEDLFDDSPPPPIHHEGPSSDGNEPQDRSTVETVAEFEDERLLAGETLPLIDSPAFSRKSYLGGSIRSIPSSPQQTQPPAADSPKVLRIKAAAKKKSWWWKNLFWICCHPFDVTKEILSFLWYQSFLVSIAIPCFALAALLFYELDDPIWTFLPGHASVAWWLNFCGRHVILLELSRIWQWFFIDKLVLSTRMAVQCLGPLLTLCFIQARGWPFTVATWGFLGLMLLEGSSQFERHWLYVSPFALYSTTTTNSTAVADGGNISNNSGSYVLTSEYYIRLLLSMMLAGFATAIKRTAVAMYFGRRTFVEFKPRLERLLKDVVLVTEIAALAEEAEIVAEEEEQQKKLAARRQSRGVLKDTGHNKVNLLGDVSWSNKQRTPQQKKTQSGNTKNQDGSDSDDDDDEDDDDDDDSEVTTPNDIKPDTENIKMRKTSSGSFRISDLLDTWDEPVNKMDKSLNASISDILRFRRALTFMDDEEPFGEQFGPASNREDLINSAQEVYQSLLKLTPGNSSVSCEFYSMLSLGDDGETINMKKQKALRKLFRPDVNNKLSELAFVQSCDSLYKKLRYFRANVGNASIIDHALESIVDWVFSFVLALVLLSAMRFNPWPLLVSISTLLVSVSFAVGSSASKWFEGMLLVAARRPFDIGDRIYMTEPSLVISDGLWYCWFVEDINLFHTTIRYAGTNEVATINNGSVANMRIMNGARSPDAAVWFQFPYRANLMEDGNMDKLKAALEVYARENPRSWHSFSYFRVDEVHPHLEKLVVTIGLQHRSSWQDLVAVLEAKAKVMCWLMEYSRKLGLIYDELPQRDIMYYGGVLKEGGVSQHRFQLHNPSNITATAAFPGPSSSPVTKQDSEQKVPTAQESSNSMFLAQLMQSHG